MKALGNVSSDIIDLIKSNRPYISFKDFLNKCHINKTAIINLIKGGAFDLLEKERAKELKIHPRIYTMIYYLSLTSEPKKKLTLLNFNSLVNNNLIPKELTFEKQVFFFNKYLKGYKWDKYYYMPDAHAMKFYYQNFNMDYISVKKNIFLIEQKTWDNIYKNQMDNIRDWLKENQETVLKQLNTKLFETEWNKYATGNISAWEMEALCFYYHEHELLHINNQKYGIINFNQLSPISAIDYFFQRNGKQIPIYKLSKIAGTVIGKNDTRHLVTLLTTDGVVTVKFTRDHYAMYNRQISEVNEKGEKKVKEKGWFTRGTKLLVTGYRRDDTFVCKRYKSTGGHSLYKIKKVENRNIELISSRYGMEENNENM